MKTLDEALDVISSNGKGGKRRVEEEAAKFVANYIEIATSKRVVAMCVSGVAYFVNKNKNPENLLFEIWLQAFADGVKIGMEMERNDSSLDVKTDLG